MPECKTDKNKTRCTCTYPCGRKGICCECLEYHWNHGEVPGCFFPKDVEQTYDRSIETFIRVYQQRKRWW